MKKIQKHIEIVRSNKPALSSMNEVSCSAIHKILSKKYSKVGVSMVDTLEDLEQLARKKPDVCFIGLKFIYHDEQKLWISTFLSEHGIAHTGSPRQAIEAEQNKPQAKQILLNAGLPTAAYELVPQGGQLQNHELRYPLFVKPASLGAGNGVDEQSIVYDQAQLQAKLNSLSEKYGVDSLVEEYLPGREFSVAVLKDHESGNLVAMPIEMKPSADANGNFMLSKALKSGALETPVIAVPESDLRQQLIRLALDAFALLNARDYGRIDIRLDAAGTPHFLEANLIPGLIDGSGNFPKACKINQDLDHQDMILQIVQLAMARNLRFNLLKFAGYAQPRAVVAQW